MKRLIITIFICSLTIISYASQYTVGNHEVESTLLATGKFEAAASQVSVINRSLVVTGKAIADGVALKPGLTISVCSSLASGRKTCDKTCDGVDDDVEIQEAIDEIAASANDYGVIKLSEGAFNLKNRLVISNPNSSFPFVRLGIAGVEGGGTSINAQNDFADSFMIVFDESVKNPSAGLALNNILFAGNDTNITIGFIDTKIGSIPLWDLRVTDCWYFDFGDTVFVVDEAWGLILDKVIIEDGDGGAVLVNGGSKVTGTQIINSKIIDNGGGTPSNTAAIRLSGTNHARIIGNELSTQASGGYGIELVGADYNIITGNTFDVNTSGQGGIRIDETSDRNILANNEFKSLNASGITIISGASNNVLQANVMVGVIGVDIVDNGTGTTMQGGYGDEQVSQTDIIANLIHWNPDNTAARSAVFDGNSVDGLFGIFPADDTVRIGESGGTDFAKFAADGDLRMQGGADYILITDEYVFRAEAGPNAGLYLAVGNGAATGGNEWEWREAGAGNAVLSFDLDDGLVLSGVGYDAIGAVDIDYGSSDVTDHTFTSDNGVTVIDGDFEVKASGVTVINNKLTVTGGTLGVLTTAPTSTFEVVGSQSASWITVTSDTTLDATQFNVYANITTVPFTITLPIASSVGGRIYSIKKIDSFASSITVDGNGSDQIDDALTFDLISQYESITIQSDSEKWWIF